MKIKRILSEVPFLIFCIYMIPYYYNGFVCPEENNFWIVRYGAPILFFELFSIILLFFLLDWADRKESIRLQDFIKIIILPMLFIFFLTYVFNIWLFPYFLLSTSLKYLAFRKIQSIDDLNRRFSSLIVSVVSILISMFIGAFFSTIILNNFQNQSNMINQFISENSPFPSSGDIKNPAGFIMLWGISYFVFLIIFTLIFEIFLSGKKIQDKTSNENLPL